MTGYVRQSAADIVPTAVVRAAPINNELNALRDAFEQTAGHRHDGTAAEGHYVPLIGDADAKNKVAVDTVNNRVGVFAEVSGTSVEQVRVQDGAIVPVTDNDIDLGTSSLEFKDLYIDGTANIDSLIADTADINAGTIDNTVVGATTPAAATVTNLTVNTAAVIASADINAGTIDGTVIGGTSAQTITGTTITATTGFVGNLTGTVTGNISGTHTGPVVGNVTGDLTGNVTASTGSSSFNNVVINGDLNMNAGSSATITNLTSPTNSGDAATKGYVDTSVSNLIDGAPSTLNTLNELAAALGDDPNFSTTVTNDIAAKVSKAGDTMTGALAMGGNKITGLGTPTANTDATTKVYVDGALGSYVTLTGSETLTNKTINGSNNTITNVSLTTGVTGILPVTSGGTGTSTPSLVQGTNITITGTWPNQTITSTGSGSMVYPGAGIPLSTGTAWGTSYSTTGTGTVVALATSPTLVTPVLGTPTSGNFSTGTFTWPTFNQNTTGTAGNITASSNSTLTTLSALSLPGSQVSGNISGNSANVTGTVAITNGGTGQTTAAAAITALTGTQTSGQYLRSNGTNAVLAAIQAGDVPTLNQNTTGTAANVTGTVAVANGGTGATSLTLNNVLLGNGTTAVQTVAPGTTGNVLTSNGTTWASSALPAGGLTTQVQYNNAGVFAGITNATSDGTTLTLASPVINQPVVQQNIQVISGNTTAVRSRTYVFTATLTLDLPASPTAGDMVMFSNRSATATPVIGRNGQNIMGLAEDMTVNNVNYFGTLVYADATRGWIFQ